MAPCQERALQNDSNLLARPQPWTSLWGRGSGDAEVTAYGRCSGARAYLDAKSAKVGKEWVGNGLEEGRKRAVCESEVSWKGPILAVVKLTMLIAKLTDESSFVYLSYNEVLSLIKRAFGIFIEVLIQTFLKKKWTIVVLTVKLVGNEICFLAVSPRTPHRAFTRWHNTPYLLYWLVLKKLDSVEDASVRYALGWLSNQ